EAARAADGEAATLDAERQQLLGAIAEADAVVSADDVTERQAQERLESTREERARVEVGLAQRRKELEHLAGQLAERYELGLEALADVPPEEDGQDEERATRVEALRARLLRLGDVNPAAIGELEELRGRHEFLEAQRVDLDRSLEDLRRTIAKLAR